MSKNPIFQERKKHVNQMSKYLIFQEVKKNGSSVTLQDKKISKNPIFQERQKKRDSTEFFCTFGNFFFSSPEILSILHAWLYRVFLVIFFGEIHDFFVNGPKNFFFNVNPYHFWNSCVTLQTRKMKKFSQTTLAIFLCFFFPPPKKKTNFFFPGPKILKKTLRSNCAKKKLLKIFFQPKNASKMVQNFCSKKWLKNFLHSKMTTKWSKNVYTKSDCKNFFCLKLTIKWSKNF